MATDGADPAVKRDLVGTLRSESTRAVLRQLMAALAPLTAAMPLPMASEDAKMLCPVTLAQIRAARAAVAVGERELAS